MTQRAATALIFLLVLALAAVAIALANRAPVSFPLLPR